MLAGTGIPCRVRVRDNAGMTRWIKGMVALAGALVLLLALLLILARVWIGTADFKGRVEQQLAAALGVPVQIGALSVALWPLPGVAVDRLVLGSQPPLTLDRLELEPAWRPLLQRRLEVQTLLLRHAVLPQQALAALAARAQPAPGAHEPQAPAGPRAAAPMPWPQRVRLEDVAWVNERGGRIVVDAQLDRQDAGWALQVKLAGGTVQGTLRQAPGPGGRGLRLVGSLDTAGVEVSALTVPSRTLSGRLDAHTELQGELAGLPESLHTDSRFTVRGAVLHGIDLAQAVRTVGLNRGGETRLDTLAGRLGTRGRALQLDNLVASSGALSASGSVAASSARQLSGHVTVSLTNASAGGNLGVPLVVGGTLDAPSVTLSRGALVGAAIGTAIAPGLGTGAGAGIGDRVGGALKGLFGK